MSGIECAFLGTLGQDAELKISKSGRSYLRFSMRVGDGDSTQWLSVLAFDPEAIVIADRFVRGACVYVEGRLSTNEWTGQDGEKRLGLSVMSWHCRLAQIGRQKVKSGATKASVAAEQVYHSPRSGPAGRLPGSGDFDDPIPFAPEVR